MSIFNSKTQNWSDILQQLPYQFERLKRELISKNDQIRELQNEAEENHRLKVKLKEKETALLEKDEIFMQQNVLLLENNRSPHPRKRLFDKGTKSTK